MKFVVLTITLCLLLCSLTALGANQGTQDKKPQASLKESAKDLFLNALEFSTEDSAAFFKSINKSVHQFRQYLSTNPDDKEALYYLGYALDKNFFGLSPGDKLPQITLADAIEISDAYEKCIALEPAHKGNDYMLTPYSKITAVWGSLAMAYLEQDKRDSADFAFREGKKRGGFPDFLLEFCRNMMNCCDSGAVLLVNGDNDTFPMWYLQAIEFHRTDLRIVNISLINTKWYLRHLKKKTAYNSPALPLSFSDVLLNAPDNSGKSLQYEFGSEKDEVISLPLNYHKKYPCIGNLKAKRNAVVTFKGIEYDSEDGRIVYLYRIQDMVIIDLLKQLAFEKKLYFAKTIDPEDFVGLQPFMSDEFLVYLVNPFLPEQLYGEDIWGELSDSFIKIFDNEEGIFTFKNVDIAKISNDIDQQRLLELYWEYIVYYARYLTDEKEDFAEAADILVNFEKVIPFANYLPFYNYIYEAMSVLIDTDADRFNIFSFSEACIKSSETFLGNTPLTSCDSYDEFIKNFYFPLSRISESAFILNNFEQQREALNKILTKNTEYSKNPKAIKEYDGNFIDTYNSIRFAAKAEYDISLVLEARNLQGDAQAIQKAMSLISEYKAGKDPQRNDLIENLNQYIEQIENGE